MFNHFYVTGVGSLGYVFIYAPLAYFITRLIYRFMLKRLIGRWIGGAVAIATLGIVLATSTKCEKEAA